MRIVRFFVVFGLLATAQICSAGTWYGKETEHLAVFKNSVTDLVIDLPLGKKMGAAPFGDPRDGSCCRAHQGLFNEVVTVVQEQPDEVQVSFDHMIYGFDEKTKQPLSTFWVHRKQLGFLRELESQSVDLSVFPPPSGTFSGLVVVLVLPWQMYSVGTRFVRVPAYDTPKEYGIRLFDTVKQRPLITKIPRDRVVVEAKKNIQDRRKLFVATLNNLVDYVQALPGNKVIPYVWGGSSCLSFSEDGKFVSDGQCWVRTEYPQIYTGYDCSELVWRLARICGIDEQVYKTTLPLAEKGHLLAEGERLEDGDLIVIPGHVMLVGSMKNNELIEASGYQFGYGSVHRVSLEQRFEGIVSYDKLVKAYRARQPLTLLQRDGSLQKQYPEFKLIKLCTTETQRIQGDSNESGTTQKRSNNRTISDNGDQATARNV